MSNKTLDTTQTQALIDAALDAQKRAYAPYSRFFVGAALLADDGSIITGCNVENASYGLCICAERSAVCSAVAQGKRAYKAVAVASSCSPPASPCGMCRQFLIEFADDMPVFMVNPQGERVDASLAALLPGNFKGDQLPAVQEQSNTDASTVSTPSSDEKSSNP